MERAVFGAGCFWHIQDKFSRVEGILTTSVGYSGGSVKNPTYEQVCTGDTGHAEVVEIEYDQDTITYSKLLDVFWSCHDPTTKNRQGPDIGHQYRSVIYYFNSEQESLARDSMRKLEKSKKFSNLIVTEIKPIREYYKAEDYHQNYYPQPVFQNLSR